MAFQIEQKQYPAPPGLDVFTKTKSNNDIVKKLDAWLKLIERV